MRTLTGTIKHLDDTPWRNALVYLTLVDGTFTNTNQYPIDVKTAKTNENGLFTFNVVPNTGLSQSYYILTTPDGKNHSFTIPDGTTPIDFSVVRQAGIIVNDPDYNNILNYLQNYIEDAIATIEASAVIAEIFTCGSTISALKAIRYDSATNKVFQANSSDATQINKCIGISSQAGNINANIQVVTSGYLFDAAWNWTIGSALFFDSGGNLTHTPGVSFYQVVALPVATNKILVSIEPPIKL